jgi:hypothetical protein
MRCFHPQGSICLSALLLASQPAAHAREWELQAGVSSAQVVRGLVYIDQPLAEVSGSWWSARGWSAGAVAAGALHAPQRSLSANAGYGWPVADGVDAYVALGHSTYRREGDWRLHYGDARFGVNVHDQLFLSVHRSFDVRMSRPFDATTGQYGGGTGPVAGTLAKEAVWRQPLPHALTLLAGVGHASVRASAGLSYWYGSVGVRAALGRADLEATWIDTGGGPARWWGAQAGKRWVGSVRWNF